MIDADVSVTVIVVTFNSRAMFVRQKAALEAQTIKDFRLIVWDNASQVSERPTAEDFPVGAEICLSETNLGFAAANNRAAAMAKTPIIALLNPDAFPDPDWLERLLEAAALHPEAAAFGSTQIDAKDPTVFDGLGDAYHAIGAPWRGGYGKRGLVPKDGETFSACAAAALYRTAAWRDAGGFDEAFFCFGEDVDLGFRLRLLGYTVRQAAAARVFHVGGASAPRRSDFAVYYGRRNRLWTFVKNMPAPLFWALAPAHCALTIGMMALAIGKPHGRATWRAVRDAISDLPRVWRQRQAIQAARRVNTAPIAAALTWSPLAPASRLPVLKPRL